MAVGRFQVMALLQAARAVILGMPLESAYSWGLNRATFIAAAKRGFKSGAGDPGKRHAVPASRDTYFLGDDMAFKTEKGGTMLFTFGGKVQTMEEFDKRVRARFGNNFDAALGESLAYVRKFDRQTLESTQAFFDDVYRPVRDKLADEWTAPLRTETSTRISAASARNESRAWRPLPS